MSAGGAGADVDATRRLLIESIEQLASLPVGEPDAGTSAFNSFRRGVGHASNGRDCTSEQILGDLEPKGPVLRFLGELHQHKKMYRKQVESVFASLLKVDDWLRALQLDHDLRAGLPSDLRSLVEERESARGMVERAPDVSVATDAPVVTGPCEDDSLVKDSGGNALPFRPEPRESKGIEEPSAPVALVPTDSAVREAVDAAKLRSQIAKAKSTSDVARSSSSSVVSSELVERGRSQIEALDFSASGKDAAIEAFETFRKAVMTSKGDSAALATLEPKRRILEFLVDMHGQHAKYRRRVASTFICLWASDAWREAVQADATLHANVCEIILDSGATADTLGTDIASLVAAVRATEGGRAESPSTSGDATPNSVDGLSALLAIVEERQAKVAQCLAGDKRTKDFLDRLSLKMRELGKVSFRGDASRWEYANGMIRPELALKKAPMYSIEFTQNNSADGVVMFFKRLFGGWSVKIDQATFEALAYGDRELPEKAYENVHMLCVRGSVLVGDRIPPTLIPRLCIVVACDEALYQSRNETSNKRLEEKEERAREMGFSAVVDEAAQPLANLEFEELSVTLDGVACNLTRASRSSQVPLKHSMVMHAVQDELLRLVDHNIDLLLEASDSSLKRMEFDEKVNYWEALRSSNAASQKLLANLFDACLCGSNATSGSATVFEDARSIAEKYVKDYPGDSRDSVADKLVQWQASLNLSTGFVTGFGGFLTMPVTIPTGMLATWITSTRLAFAVAHIYGHDIFHPCTVNAVLYCLTGSGKVEEADHSPEEGLRSRLLAHMRRQRGEQEQSGAMLLENETELDVADAELIPSSEEFQSQYANLYDLLRVQQGATQQEVRVAYRRLALRSHPDKLHSTNSEEIRVATQRFQVLAAAYDVLGDPAHREAYDLSLREGAWSWKDFAGDCSLEMARSAFDGATKRLTEGLLASHYKKYDCGGHMVSRALAQVAVDVAEALQVSTAKSLVQAGAAAELRSSIVAGERLAASAATRSSSKLIPLLGALISGGIDCATTASVGRCSVRVFKA